MAKFTDVKVSDRLIVGGELKVGGATIEYVDVADAATVDVLASNANKLHIIPDGTQDIAITLPTPKAGLYFKFVYGGVAADVTGVSIETGDAAIFLEGNLLGIDLTDATPVPHAAVFANGSSNTKVTVDTPETMELNFLGLSATKYKVWGSYGSEAIAVVAD